MKMKGFPKDKIGFILSLMEEFELIFRADKNQINNTSNCFLMKNQTIVFP